MDGLLDLGGIWLAKAYAFYGIAFLLVPAFFFADVVLLAAVAWALFEHSRGLAPWPSLPDAALHCARLAVELVFGLLNPVVYLAVLTPSLPGFSFPALGSDAARWSFTTSDSTPYRFTPSATWRILPLRRLPRSRTVGPGTGRRPSEAIGPYGDGPAERGSDRRRAGREGPHLPK